MDQPVILLVDDDANDEELARLALEGADVSHRLEVVRDGRLALEHLLGSRGAGGRGPAPLPDLILLDLKLPKVNGLDVLAQLRRDERTRLVPVVVFTSSNEDRDLAQAYDRGANAYVCKPVDFGQYRALVADLATFWLVHNLRPAAADRQPIT